ncbi:VOC family protein, partial [Endothiovibrio diazotrophicus]
MSTTLTPNLMSDDVNRSVAFYRDHLGFRLLMGVPFDSEEPVNELPEEAALQWAMLG